MVKKHNCKGSDSNIMIPTHGTPTRQIINSAQESKYTMWVSNIAMETLKRLHPLTWGLILSFHKRVRPKKFFKVTPWCFHQIFPLRVTDRRPMAVMGLREKKLLSFTTHWGLYCSIPSFWSSCAILESDTAPPITCWSYGRSNEGKLGFFGFFKASHNITSIAQYASLCK